MSEHAKLRDAVLLRMLKTPPEPHKPRGDLTKRRADIKIGKKKKSVRKLKKAGSADG
jgi:hypothetical protein